MTGAVATATPTSAPHLPSVEIAGHHILDAYSALRHDLDDLLAGHPAQRVEFVLANDTDLDWHRLGSALFAGDWAEGASLSERMRAHRAIGGAIENIGGTGAALGFSCSLHDDMAGELIAFFVLLGCTSASGEPQVELYADVMPRAAFEGIARDEEEIVHRIADKLESRDIRRDTAHLHLGFGKLDLALTATHSGGAKGVVELAISYA